MKKTGDIQVVFKPTKTAREKNWVYPFNGLFNLVRLIWKHSKSNPSKIMIFFDQKEVVDNLKK